MDELNVLYMCDDGFAEVAGVSILSLFENNSRDKANITVYLLGVGISDDNRNKFYRLGHKYGHKLVFVDATEKYSEIQKLNISDYRGSAMTNLRLYFDTLVPTTVHKILYIDCDTIICQNLMALCSFSLNGKLMAMAYDAYAKLFSKNKSEEYYNAGVLLIDCDKWRNEQWSNKIQRFIDCNTQTLSHPDQDIFNIVCKNEIELLPIKYNFQVVHRRFSDKIFYRFLAPECYYSEKEIRQAYENPAIIHLIRYLGTNPWKADGKWHPDYCKYMYYKNKSEWRGNTSVKEKISFIIRCERVMSKVMPQVIFFPITLIAIKLAEKSDSKNI